MNEILSKYFIDDIVNVILELVKDWDKYEKVILELEHSAYISRLIHSISPTVKGDENNLSPSLIAIHVRHDHTF